MNTKCKNHSCSNTFTPVKRGAYWKKFCSTRCRQQWHGYSQPEPQTSLATTTTTTDSMEENIGKSLLNRAIKPAMASFATSNGLGVMGAVGTGVVADVALPKIKKGINDGSIKPIGTFSGVGLGWYMTKDQPWYIQLLGSVGGGFVGNGFEKLLRDIFISKPSLATTTTTTNDDKKSLIDDQVIKQLVEEHFKGDKTADQILSTTYKTYSMRGDYFGLVFGYNPSDPFHTVAYGMPGSGKTTLSIQFANYFANKFGKVKFLSSEMKEGNGLKSILKRTSTSGDKLIFDTMPNSNNIDEHINRLKASNIKLLIIDSANHLRWSADDIERIKNEVPGISTFTILQSVKEGNFKGQNDYAHNADVVLKIQDLEVVTQKTRFEKKNVASVQINM